LAGRRAAGQIGVEALFLIDKFKRGAQAYERGLKQAESATDKFKSRVEQSSARADQAVNTGVKSMAAGWASASVAVAAFATAVVKGYQMAEQAAQARGMRESLVSMGRFYKANVGTIVGELQRVSDGTLSTAQAVEVANRALLAGGAAFAGQVPRLFQIARAAAVATGKDVMWVFETLTRGIAKGSPLLIDNAEIYMTISGALDDYAAKLGKSSDELTRQEKTVATLNAVLEQGDTIIQAVGEDALQVTQGFDRLEASAKNFKDSLLAATFAGSGLNRVLNFLADALDALAHVSVMAIAGLQGLRVLMSPAGLIGALLEGKSIIELFDETVRTAFLEGAKALGHFKDEGEEVPPLIDETAVAADRAAAALDEYSQKIEDLQVKYTEQLVEMQTKAAQREIDAAINRARRLEDIERNTAQRRQQIAQQYAQQMADIERQGAEQAEQAAYEHGQRLAEIERQYQDRLRDIQRQYDESMYDAIARRDATAALKAMRQRDQQLDDARRDRDQQRADANRDYARQREEQRRHLEQQREEARRAYQEQQRDLEENLRQQKADLERSLKRQEEDQKRHDKWRVEELQRQYAIEVAEASAHYTGLEDQYRQHLLRKAELWAQFQSNMSYYSSPWAGPGERGGYAGGFAEGGAFVAQGPTTATFGERGPELVVAQPVTQLPGPVAISGSMRHEIGGAVQAQMSGFSGRLTAAVSRAVMDAFREVLR
jgi:hypothetical protein